MRITGGEAKGRRLASLKGSKIRPTSDRVREAIFNLIGQHVAGFRVLDLFAGTGSLGIEALSRGASWALFIDHSLQSIKQIKKNLAICGYDQSASVLKKELTKGLPWKHPQMKEKFDLIFIDPPYDKKIIPRLLRELLKREILASPSLVIAETSKEDVLPAVLEKLKLVDTRIYGDTKISIFQYGDDL
jgi:16S rRNA (guanine966-N2)-methyltransferase